MNDIASMVSERFSSIDGQLRDLAQAVRDIHTKIDQRLERLDQRHDAISVVVRENSTIIGVIKKDLNGIHEDRKSERRARRGLWTAIGLAIWSTLSSIGIALFELVKK